jgi:hypothetical protein
MTITLADYWMGRDVRYALALDTQTRRNAAVTVDLANRLLVLAKMAGVPLLVNSGGGLVSSGWRPPLVNASTPGASTTSLHMTGQALDLFDPRGAIDRWMLSSPQPLIDLGLWVEDSSHTPGWAHIQTRPPRSGNRFFMP